MAFAHTYAAAVGQEGAGAYANAGEAKQCKEFKEDFKENCSSSSSGGASGTNIAISTDLTELTI